MNFKEVDDLTIHTNSKIESYGFSYYDADNLPSLSNKNATAMVTYRDYIINWMYLQYNNSEHWTHAWTIYINNIEH